MYQEFVAHSTEVTCLTFGTKSYKLMATGGEDCKVNIWQIGNTTNLYSLDKNKTAIQSLCFDNDEQCIVSGNKSGSIKIYDLTAGKLVRNLLGHQVAVNCLQYHAFGEFIVSGSADCTMKVWDIRNKACLQTYSGHDKAVTCVRFSPDGRWVASSAEDGSLHIWDLVAGKLLNSFLVKPGFVTSFDFNPSEFMLSAVTSVRTVKVWDLDTMKPAFSLPAESSAVRALSHTQYVGRDGTVAQLCTATRDTLKVWAPPVAGVGDPSGGQARLLASRDMGWGDRVADLKVSPTHHTVLAGSFISNFVSVYSIDLDDVLTAQPGTTGSSNKQSMLRNNSRSPQPPLTSATVTAQHAGAQPKPIGSMVAPLSLSNRDSKRSNDGCYGSVGCSDYVDSKSEDKAIAVDSRRREHPISSIRGGLGPTAVAGAESKMDANVNAGLHFEDTDITAPSYHSDFEPLEDHLSGSLDELEEEDDEVEAERAAKLASHAAASSRPTTASGGPPQVYWESDQAAREMATSMGESFWKRFQESQRKHSHGTGDAKETTDDNDIDCGEDSELAAQFDALGGELLANYGDASSARVSNVKRTVSLEAMLPPSAFVDEKETSNPAHIQSSRRDIDAESPPVNKPGSYRPVELNQLRAQQQQKKAVTAVAVGRPSSSSSGNSKNNSSNNNNNRDRSPQLEVVGARRNSVGNSNNNSNNDADLRHCYATLDKLSSSSSSFHTSMLHRLTALKILRRDWERGYILEALDYLRDIQQSEVTHDASKLLILSDFLSSVTFKGPNVTLDCAVKLMPMLEDMLTVSRDRDGWRSPKVALTVLQTFVTLLESFGDLIRQARAVQGSMMSGAVDISREERVRKCFLCHQVLLRCKDLLESIGAHHHRSPKINEAIRTFHTLYDCR